MRALHVFFPCRAVASGLFLLGFLPSAGAAEIPGVPRDSNFGNTGGYDSSRVEARLVVQVKEETDTVHFIRDNNDPRVVTHTYLLKNVDPYEFRDYLRQMVQSKRVGNATLQQQYPSNQSNPAVSTTGSPELTSATAQPGYSPSVQLGSNTAVECLKYADGTGLLMVSAEDYRFADHPNGMGIDTLVAMLDDPALGALSYGSQMFIYMPKFVPARNLMPLIQNMGMNVNDATELWQGTDVVAYDPELNWLIFDVTNYSCTNIGAMLAKYDVPIPQVRLKITVYELNEENDDRIGIDFQSWKNNEGADFFSVGDRYRSNWSAAYTGQGLMPESGSERTSFYNFNPKWNTRYIDFLESRGKAKILHSGELLIRNNTGGSFSRTTQIFYSDASTPEKGAQTDPDLGAGPYKLLSNLIQRMIGEDDYPVSKGNQQIITKSTGYGFTMTVNQAVVGTQECRFSVTLSNTSLLGFASNGTPRISQGNVVKQEVSLPFGKENFVIGGLTKEETVTSKTGIPWLMEIPYLEYLFSSKSTSIKRSRLFVLAHCVWDAPQEQPAAATGKRHTR